MFFEELHDVMDRLATFAELIISFLVGDLHMRLDHPSDPYVTLCRYTRRRPGFIRLHQPGHVDNARQRRNARCRHARRPASAVRRRD